MKKISTLSVALLAAASMSAQTAKTEITLGTWSPWDAATATVNGNTLTMSAAWAGAGNWLANGTECADWSDGDYLELDVSNCTGNFNAAIQYNDRKTFDDKGNPTVVKELTTTGTLSDGDKVCYIKLNENYSDKVVNIWLQSTTATASVTVDKAYLVSEEEYQAYLAEKSKGEQVAWEGSSNFGTSWDGSLAVQISAGKFASTKSGATFTFYYDCNSDADYSQIGICDGSWNTLSSAKDADPQWGTINVGGTTSYTTTLSDDDIKTIQSGGMVIKGYNATLTKVTFTNPTTDGINSVQTTKKVNEGATYNLAGQRVGKTFRGMVIRNGKKYIQK